MKKMTVMAAAAATAATLTVGGMATAPPEMQPKAEASSAVYTTGPIFGLLDALGIDIGTLLPAEIQSVLAALGVQDIGNLPANSVDINNALNDIDFTVLSVLGRPFARTRTGFVIGLGWGSFATSRAYQALRSSAAGDTWDGYHPLEPASPTNQTNLILALLLNPGRANGGALARLADVAGWFGIDTVTPPAGAVPGSGIRLNTLTVDATWAYQPASDFPVTLNPFSVANSLFAFLPTNLLGGFTVQGDSPTSVAASLAAFLAGAALGQSPDGRAFYLTLVPNDLPLVEPLRLPSRIINLLTGWDLPTPIADAFEPAAKILANIGYTDVVTPTDLADNPALVALGLQPYDRTFDPAELSIPTPLYSRLPLTFDEYLRVPGDVLTALIVGIVDSIRNVLDPATWQEAFNREPEETTLNERLAVIDPDKVLAKTLAPVTDAIASATVSTTPVQAPAAAALSKRADTNRIIEDSVAAVDAVVDSPPVADSVQQDATPAADPTPPTDPTPAADPAPAAAADGQPDADAAADKAQKQADRTESKARAKLDKTIKEHKAKLDKVVNGTDADKDSTDGRATVKSRHDHATKADSEKDTTKSDDAA